MGVNSMENLSRSGQDKSRNILFIQADQLSAQALPAYGNKFAITPNIDKLAAHSVLCETAYCNFPLCAPSRFSMATGQLASNICAYDNAAEMSASIPTYAHYLRRLGYRTILSGKMHFIGPDQYHGFDTRLTPDLYPADFSWVPNWGDEGDRDTNDARSILISGISQRSVQIDFDEEVAYRANRQIYELAHNPQDEPFFLQVSFTHPHEPYLCQREFWDLYADVDIPSPSIGPLRVQDHDAHSVRLLKDFGLLDVDFTSHEILRARRAYYGSISYIDRLIGSIIRTLEETGLADNTVIVFASDHGEMLGERGMWFKKHFFEPALRVPLFIKIPGSGAQRIRIPVSLVDLLPTFVGLATGSTQFDEFSQLEGINLVSTLNKMEGSYQRSVYAEYTAEATIAPIYMIRKGVYKFIRCSGDQDLMYNIETDPHERVNLANNMEYAEIVTEFSAEVMNKWNEQELIKAILTSQRNRRLILESYGNSTKPRWNHGETQGEKVAWYRGDGSYNEWAFDYLPEHKDPKDM